MCCFTQRYRNVSFTMSLFWREFEEFNNSKFPKVIKDILKLCAIDRATFVDITEDTIVQIENIVNKNKSVLKKSCYASCYEKNEKFEFLFGHRLLILSLPKKYTLFCNDKKEKKQLRKERLVKLKENSNADDSETTSSTTLKTTGPQEVKNLLLERLNNYKNNKKNYTINADAVTKFRIIGNEAYCVVQCPFCEKKISCTYVCRWVTNNFEKHILFHLNKKSNTQRAEQPTIRLAIRSNQNVLSQVDKIVG